MPRPLIEADIRALKFLWIRGWRVHTLRAWVDAFTFENKVEWWKYRPWA